LEPGGLIAARIVEFLASIENSELFTFDRHGTAAQPDNPISCIIVSTSFAEVEKGKTYNQYGFVIREA
jgi:hypothetical protein